jgi:hypothetical protein
MQNFPLCRQVDSCPLIMNDSVNVPHKALERLKISHNQKITILIYPKKVLLQKLMLN